MSISPPSGLVLTVAKWLWGKLTQRLLMSTYMHSHEKWALRHRLGARWDAIDNNLEYSLRFGMLTDKGEPLTRIAFKTTNTPLARIELTFEAEGSGVRYQQIISLSDVNATPLVVTLTNVPALNFSLIHGNIAFLVESYHIRNCRVWLADGSMNRLQDSPRFHLTQQWCLNDKWVWRWDMPWNYNSIDWAKRRIGDYWKWAFKVPFLGIYPPFSTPRYRFFVWKFSSLRWLMTRQWCLTVQFWMAVWSGLLVMNSDGILQWRWKKPENP